MQEYSVFVFAALALFVYGLFSRLSERSPVSAAAVFVSLGIVAGPLGFGLLEAGIKAPAVRVIAEVTLVLVLFVDASAIDFRSFLRRTSLPFRLLVIGLPLTMAFGVVVAAPLFREMGLLTATLMAFMLSPTDAALGQPVMTSSLVPENIKEAINVESGLNDGIVLPPILACIAALSPGTPEHAGVVYWVTFVGKQFLFGPLVGALVGFVGGTVVDTASRRGWMSHTFRRLAAWSLAVTAYGLAEALHGNGFIAAFFGGLTLRIRTPEVREQIREFGEAEGQQLALLVFLLFGLGVVDKAVPFWDAKAWLYAALSLTVIRMIPVALCLRGTGLSWYSMGFIGWFGPRGIASVLYLLIVVNELGLQGYEPMLSVVVLTVLLSVYLHGITAVPMSRLYAAGQGMLEEQA